MVACARTHAYMRSRSHQCMPEHPETSLQVAHMQQHTAMSTREEICCTCSDKQPTFCQHHSLILCIVEKT
eukprot:366012-Chlamydomonas_euryale.AAC.4